jgi:hypothetical protein
MEIFAALSVGLLMAAAFVVAVRTFALWRRTRGLPELLLSLMLFSATVLGYPAMIATTQVPATQMWPLHVGAQALMSFGFTCLLLFTLKVFRPHELWARCLVAATFLLLVTGGVAYFIEVTGANPRPQVELLGINLLSSLPIGVAYAWTTVESLTYYRRLRLQLRLGLTDVVVANRVLLWGLMSLSAGVAVVVNIAAMLAGSFLSAPIVLVSSCLGIVHACCLFLTFHPPRWYKLWLERTPALAA